MNDLINPKSNVLQPSKEQIIDQFSKSGLYVKEDDQDWGSAGMNDIQQDTE